MAPRYGFHLANVALMLALGFTGWAVLAPDYPSGESLTEANPELVARLAIAFPLAVTGTVWLLLHHACSRDRRWSRAVAQGIAWILVAFSWLTGFTIGLFVLPIALALLAAALLTPVASR